jgi:hypothetical protein
MDGKKKERMGLRKESKSVSVVGEIFIYTFIPIYKERKKERERETKTERERVKECERERKNVKEKGRLRR